MSATACGLCGADPAEGMASIDDTRYCHGDEGTTCFTVASMALPLDARAELIEIGAPVEVADQAADVLSELLRAVLGPSTGQVGFAIPCLIGFHGACLEVCSCTCHGPMRPKGVG